ncbi:MULTISPECIES: META domain-containing protein [Weeksella]|mgnify:FL=1|uniref:DUF306 domain-containing protein n=1 Tax=Weeksella virosa (strain ATCC 43766 / DSM 16922 / JCM 21250 / CCUG 30538 / CDC 9751 / IAM 14551 / NBRC 16016 / NCTC 11634 / CL345/78) TaxID=865938 RepID=F0NYL2_WEEVC|nr:MULTISPECIES: META domain-containing protein [Weeksella]ADX67132.1 protein of unknown function DUF306 Meta and HslJ [Weeksella virosa DSM 16922]MDK7676239.1 META domain-containing protein [Weeksella virosa]OFM81568.1 hypothetical protein HMPREF2660_00645 [Weeksella sp. HMSC059D05]SUP53403.1 heat-inducible protein [Weeksella virosa]VEH63131.1 heat-inducible protein [Weeksella virosa]
MQKIRLTLVLMIGFFMNSCQTAAPVTDFSKIKQILETNKWVLQDNTGNVKGLDQQDVVLNFRYEDGLTVNGFAGCNSYQGKATLNSTTIRFSEIGSTKVYCPQMNQEKAYLDMLREVNRYEINGKNLSLFKDNLVLIRFKAL